MNDEVIKYLIERLLLNAKEASDESKANRADAFAQGRNLAYYEMLDILKSELEIRDMSLKTYGIDVDIDSLI